MNILTLHQSTLSTILPDEGYRFGFNFADIEPVRWLEPNNQKKDSSAIPVAVFIVLSGAYKVIHCFSRLGSDLSAEAKMTCCLSGFIQEDESATDLYEIAYRTALRVMEENLGVPESEIPPLLAVALVRDHQCSADQPVFGIVYIGEWMTAPCFNKHQNLISAESRSAASIENDEQFDHVSRRVSKMISDLIGEVE